MKRKGLSPDQFTRLAVATMELPFFYQQREPTDYILDVMETVINFHNQITVLVNSLTYFREHVQQQQNIYTHQQLQAFLKQFPNDQVGNEVASQLLWGNRLWTRIELLRRLLDFFESIGVTDQEALRAWAYQASFERDWKGRVKGLGIAVFHWLKIRCGVDSIKPDVWVINFGKRVIGKHVSEKVLVDSFAKIAPLVGQSLATLDITIWHYEKMAMATKDSPPLRLIAWHLLHNGIQEKLTGQPFADIQWQLLMDDVNTLRYERGGLQLRPSYQLFGDSSSGKTVINLYQSGWTEAFWLELEISNDDRFAPFQFDQVTNYFADSDFEWELKNEPHFTAALDLEESLFIDPSMMIDKLSEWMEEIVQKTMEGIKFVIDINQQEKT
jgi:hypothetical protein